MIIITDYMGIKMNSNCINCGMSGELRAGLCTGCFCNYQEAIDDYYDEMSLNDFLKKHHIKERDLEWLIISYHLRVRAGYGSISCLL